MNLRKLAFANLRRNKLAATLNVILMAIGIATVVILLLFSNHMRQRMQNDAKQIDMVIGAKGSPSQLVLSAVYHADIPNGNIDHSELARWQSHPLVKQAIPQSLGDSWRGYRIVGTTPEYAKLFNATLASGEFWHAGETHQVVIGSDIAASGLKLGDKITSVHGLGIGGHAHEQKSLVISGVLEPTGKVIDRLILTSLEAVWDTHKEEHHGDHHDEFEAALAAERAQEKHKDHEEHVAHKEEDGHKDHKEHAAHKENDSHKDHGDHGDHDEHKEITTLLITFKNKLAATTLPHEVNAEPGLQAARPAWEMARMQQIMGIGIEAFEMVGWLLVFTAGLSVFVMLYQALETRRYDLAMLRCLGATQFQVGISLLLESLLLMACGAILGLLVGHTVATLIGMLGSHPALHGFTGLTMLSTEWLILLIAVFVGVLAALIPAWRVYQTDVAEVLTQ